MQSVGERADKLSMFATYFGNPALVNEQPQRYHDVTAERVNAFARERLGPDNRATLLYVPRDNGGSGKREAGSEVEEEEVVSHG